MPVLEDQLRAFLRAYGLEELAGPAAARFVDGMPSAAELELWLEEQPVVQRKFSAVFQRRQQGLPPISIADVVEYQRQAAQLSSYYDLPPGFIDVNELLVKDVSVSELGERVALAQETIAQRPDVVEQLQRLYGLSEGDAIAYALDPETGLQAVTRRFNSARVAAQAQRQAAMGLSEQEAGGLVDLGVTEAEAQAGFGTLGRYREVTQQLIGEQDPAMSRESQLGVVAGTQAATSELEKRARKRTSVFDEGGGLAANQAGVFGAGVAGG